jgi:hypothetical protein
VQEKMTPAMLNCTLEAKVKHRVTGKKASDMETEVTQQICKVINIKEELREREREIVCERGRGQNLTPISITHFVNFQ